MTGEGISLGIDPPQGILKAGALLELHYGFLVEIFLAKVNNLEQSILVLTADAFAVQIRLGMTVIIVNMQVWNFNVVPPVR